MRQQNDSKPAVNTDINVAAKSPAVSLILMTLLSLSPVNTVINVAAKRPAVSLISTTLLSLSLDQQQGMLIDQLPGWCDKKMNKTTLFKRKRLSGSQASMSRIRTKMSD